MAAAPAPALAFYDDPHSLFCSKLKSALHHKGVAFTAIPLPCGGTSAPEYRAIVPTGKIPALLVTEPGEAKVHNGRRRGTRRQRSRCWVRTGHRTTSVQPPAMPVTPPRSRPC